VAGCCCAASGTVLIRHARAAIEVNRRDRRLVWSVIVECVVERRRTSGSYFHKTIQRTTKFQTATWY
jgi:hypothetical protein